MYQCDQCYDYSNGHICKHIHRVHSIRSHPLFTNSTEDVSHDCQGIPEAEFSSGSEESEIEPLEYAESIKKINRSVEYVISNH